MLPLLGLLSPLVSKVLDRIPNKDEREKARLEFEAKLAENELKIVEAMSGLDAKQVEVNIEEAKSSNWFVSAWRPGVAWVCVLAFTWAYVLQPVIVFIAAAIGHPIQELPQLAMGEMMPVLLGLLGLGTLRTLEKQKDVHSKH